MEQIESLVEKIIKSFEEKPISTTIKGLLILWLLKEIVKIFKK